VTGIGLRAPHYAQILRRRPALDFLEVHSENFFAAGGPALAMLERFRALYRMSFHGVGLSLGSTDPLDAAHLAKLSSLVRRFDPFLVSEHLCWSSAAGRHANDLLPLPFTREALDHVVARIGRVQEALGREILVENVSSYLAFPGAEIDEWEFVAEAARRSGCRILLDVNNVYVNASNHGFEAHRYLDAIPSGHVGEIHLAGHEARAGLLVDTHGARVCDGVWKLYARAVERCGAVPALVEWDIDIPALDVLLEEAATAQRIASRAAEERAA
jgi:uncharacterized protein (UPF0276 family)